MVPRSMEYDVPFQYLFHPSSYWSTTMEREKMKKCRICNIELNKTNWAKYHKNNYMYICNSCKNEQWKAGRIKRRIREGKTLREDRRGKYSIFNDENNNKCALIKLTKGKWALIDFEDLEIINKWNWYFNTQHKGYACRDTTFKGQKKRLYLHRYLMNAKKGQCTDHINGNTLDNRKKNLRIVTQRQNMQNILSKKYSSKYPGVYKDRIGKWCAHIKINGKERYLGSFKKEIDAFNTYKQKVEELGDSVIAQI